MVTARGAVDRSLESQFDRGLFRAGPGAGAFALDRLTDLLYGLKHAGIADYYARPVLREHVGAVLQLLSPAGTLPLFGETALDDSSRSTRFLLKVAGQMPEPLRGRCLAAVADYWRSGRYLRGGPGRFSAHYLGPLWFFARAPLLLFQYDGTAAAAAGPGASAVLGDGRVAVLRSGAGRDALYLAINAGRSVWTSRGRDILSFDLHGYSGLLLHGPGHPRMRDPGYEESFRTEAANTLTFEGTGQAEADCAGVAASLLNQRRFDHVRLLADTTYDHGQVQRDVVMVRPETARPGYFVVVDEVHTINPGTQVAWFLHGRGTLTRGVDQVARWVSPALAPPAWRTPEVSVLVWSPDPAEYSSARGRLYARNPRSGQATETLVLRWAGSRRFATVLFPIKKGVVPPKMEAAGPGIGRVGGADWMAIGDAGTRRTAGPLGFVGECVVARERNHAFPALIVISGSEIRMGPHSLLSTKPVTASMDGLRGTLLTSRPDTEVEIRSPEINAASRFQLDGAPLPAPENGLLRLGLRQPGPHSLEPAAPEE